MVEPESDILKKGDINEKYRFEETIRQGSFGKLKKAKNKTSGEKFAVKFINKSDMQEEDLLAFQSEVEILSQIDHPNVAKLFEVWEDKSKLYLVLELMSGGELSDSIFNKKKHYSEREVADMMRPIVDAIRYCHMLGLAHRNLKLENLMYANKEPHALLKISDLGLANSSLMMTHDYIMSYITPPEVLEGKDIGEAADLWSIGIITYILLCGFPPFFDEDDDKLCELISKAEVKFPSPYWDNISEDARDLIRKLLCPDPRKRPKADQVLSHPWMVGVAGNPWFAHEMRRNETNIAETIRK